MLATNVGTTIRERREQLGWSQAALAQLIGASPDEVDQWEWGEGAPNAAQATLLSNALGVPYELVAPAPEILIDLIPPSPADLPRPLPPASVQIRDAWSRIKGRVVKPPSAPPPVAVASTPAAVTAPATPRSGGSFLATLSPLATAALVAAALVIAFLAYTMGSGSRDGEVGSLQEEVDDLAAARSTLVTEVGRLENQVAAESARADNALETAEAQVAPVYTRNEELVAENDSLVAENEFLRKGIVISRASSEIDLVALTIDDGGSQEANEAVLEILAEKNVTATLFPSGDNINAMPAVWARAVEEGHELGNHTLGHQGVRDLSRSELRQQLKGWQEAVDNALGESYETRWFRPPYMLGFEDLIGPDRARDVLSSFGMITALWDVETFYALFSNYGPQLAGPSPDANDVRRHVVGSATAGSIVLLHFGPLDIGALPGIIDGLRDKGLEPVSLSTLMDAQTEMLGASVADGVEEPSA